MNWVCCAKSSPVQLECAEASVRLRTGDKTGRDAQSEAIFSAKAGCCAEAAAQVLKHNHPNNNLAQDNSRLAIRAEAPMHLPWTSSQAGACWQSLGCYLLSSAFAGSWEKPCPRRHSSDEASSV
jgi:hypothetical protein